MNKVYILNAKRTPIGKFLGNLKEFTADELCSFTIKELLKNNFEKIKSDVEMLIIGNVISAGLGLNMAKNINVLSGLPDDVIPMTINRACASGMDSIIYAYNLIKNGEKDVIIAGGTESMSNAPFINKKIRRGKKFGDIVIEDSLKKDGLTDFLSNKLMGEIVDNYCIENNISLKEQNDYAIKSYTKARNTNISKKYEICKIKNKQKIINTDEEISNFVQDKFIKLKPLFNKNGTITAGNASKIADGACCILMVSEKYLNKIKEKNIFYKPLCEIIDYDVISGNSNNFVAAPSKSIKNILNKNKLDINNIDYFEINEAFSCVPIICKNKLNLNFDNVNLNGGGISLGHPLGCSGAKIICSLLYNLHHYKKNLGIASICVGTGGASSILLKNVKTA